MPSSFGVVWPVAAILALSAGLAAGVVSHPAATIAAAVSIFAVVVARCFPALVDRLFMRALAILLVGYALLDRPFAGLGAPPLYVGEIVLALGLLTIVAAGRDFRLAHTPMVYLLVAFMGWGALRTLPYLGIYGMDALRDAVIWGYGIFAFLVMSLVVRHNLTGRAPEFYARILPWIVVITPACVIALQWTGIGRSLGIKSPKAGDAAVHLGGAAAFLLAGLRTRHAARVPRWVVEWGIWLPLLIGLVAMGSLTRGGLLAALLAMVVVVALLPLKGGRKLLLAGSTAMMVAALWLGWGASLHIREGRGIDPEQIATNLMSIVGGTQTDDLDGTRRWRLLWWQSIIDYTVHGPYFWTGKGFGINLASDDKFVPKESFTRSPHNGHLTILARAGVPGFVLWALLQLVFAGSMLAGFFRARQAGQRTRAAALAWVLGYWIAFLVNGSFDVYLEGPQAGIWFWCLFGYGMALVASEPPHAHSPSRRWASAPPRRRQQPVGAV
jgi:hypothetical protein